jgi:hypothetical protein
VKVKSVTRTTAELARTLPPGNLYLCTRILYWKKAEKRSIADEINIDFDETTNESSDGNFIYAIFKIDEIERLQDLLKLMPSNPTVLEQTPAN